MNPKSKALNWASFALALWALGACAKKPKPPVEEPATREVFQSEPSRTVPDVSEEELRRQRIMAEAREVFQTIYYPLDRSTLDVKAKSILTVISKFMKMHGEVSFTVAGHCDEGEPGNTISPWENNGRRPSPGTWPISALRNPG